MDYSLIAILTLAVALMLLVAEIFIPSAGVIAVLAIASLGTSVWAAWLAWWGTNPALWWTYIRQCLDSDTYDAELCSQILSQHVLGQKNHS